MASQQEAPMQLAEILSDLVSLRVCDQAAALALVSARPSTSTSDIHATSSAQDEQDPDLARAKELLKLHYEVKEANKRGELRSGLEEARRGVDGAVG